MELKSWPGVLETLLTLQDLTIGQAEWAMQQVVTGQADPAQLGAFLAALRAKGESVGELVGLRDAFLANAVIYGGGGSPEAVRNSDGSARLPASSGLASAR